MAESSLDVSDLIGRRPLWRRWRVTASVVLIGLIAGLGYYGFVRNSTPATPATTQEVKVTLGSLATTLTASGTAAAEQLTPLTLSAGGVVTEVLVRLGEEVKAGQPLVRLDARDARRKLETAESGYVQAQLRLKQLLDPSAADRTASTQSLVSARAQLESAQAAYASLGQPPTAIDLTAAENSVASAKAGVQAGQNSVDSSLGALYQSQLTYCGLSMEPVLALCDPDKMPISPAFVARLQTSIARGTTVPNANLVAAVSALISSNASHLNALANRETTRTSLAAAQAKLAVLTEPPTADVTRAALAAVHTAQAAYDSAVARADALMKPGELDLGLQQQAVRAAQIAVQQAQDALDDTTLSAPFSGKVGNVTAIVGQRIGSGAAAVVLSNPDAIRMDLTISEADLVNLKAGMLGLARFDSLPRNTYVVKVIGVSSVPTVTQGVVTYPVQAAILRGNALNDIRDQLPSLARALSSGPAGAQLAALLSAGGQGGQQGQRAQGSGTPGAQQGQRAQGNGTPGSPRGPGGGAGGAAGASGAAGAGGTGGALQALLNPPLPAAGMNASITLLVSVIENQLLVPSGAVRRQGNQSFVYMPGPVGGSPVQKPVVTAGTDGTSTAIGSGLAEGDVVLVGAIGTATPTGSRTPSPGIGGGPGGGSGGGPGGGIR